MKVSFKFPRQLGGVIYPKGTHEVPDQFKDHWFLLAEIQNGNCAILKDGAPAKAEKPADKKPEAPAPNYHEQLENSEKQEGQQEEQQASGGEEQQQPEETAKERKARKQREARAAKRAKAGGEEQPTQ